LDDRAKCLLEMLYMFFIFTQNGQMYPRNVPHLTVGDQASTVRIIRPQRAAFASTGWVIAAFRELEGNHVVIIN